MTDFDTAADVVVVGFGGAGAAAAITAHDAGASVLVVEKARRGGGNTRESAGSVRHLPEPAAAVPHYEALTLGTTSAPVVQAFVDQLAPTAEWLSGLGATLTLVEGMWFRGYPPALANPYPGLAAMGAVGQRFRVESPRGEAGGEGLWDVLEHAAHERGIRVLYETSARRLLRSDGRVVGLLASGPDGELRVGARKGVVLACGGFAWSPGLIRDQIGIELPALSPPGVHTGDGVRMAQDVGADLWHMNAIAMVLGYKLPGVERALQHMMPNAAFMYVDRRGKRFINETGFDFHAIPLELLRLEQQSASYPTIPAYVIFDETARAAGPIVNMVLRGAREVGWSQDNQQEIEKGWIARAEGVEALAQALGLDPAGLAATVREFNAACAEGQDRLFGRAASDLLPLNSPPYYGIAIWPTIVNTQGGPRRNERAEVLDAFGHPIKGLYSAGELGSMWAALYPGAGNVSEALVFGRIAGREVASQTPIV